MIHIHNFLPGYTHSFVQKYQEILKYNGIESKLIDNHSTDFWQEVKYSELFIIFLGQTTMHLQRQLALISIIDKQLKVPCFPNWDSVWHFDDKVAQQMMMEAYGFPMIKGHLFWEMKLALAWAKETSYPQVFKLKGGAGSLNIAKVNTAKEAKRVITKMFGKGIRNGRVPSVGLLTVFKGDYKTLIKSYSKELLFSLGFRSSALENWSRHHGYAYFQDFLPNNSYDTRITVIGKRAFGFIRHNRPNDFRSSGSGSIDFNPNLVDQKMLRIAFDMSHRFNFHTMAYDFLYDEYKQPVIGEMCCQFADWAIHSCPGFWDENLNWCEGHFWPQYLQLCDLLHRDDLNQPDFPGGIKKSALIKI